MKKNSPLIPVSYNEAENGVYFFIKIKGGLTFKASYIFEENILLVPTNVFCFRYSKEQLEYIIKQLSSYDYNTVWKERL